MSFINHGEINIVTLEDPVEASLPGINHVGIRERGGVNFASGLRAILRQDPDVRQMIRSRARADEILPVARDLGWRPLREAGIERALRGDTTLAEVRRVLYQVD